MPRSRPKTDLTAEDLRVIQMIWQTFGFVGRQEFFNSRELPEIYPRLHSKSAFHEWVVYTIIFQAHLTYRYEAIVQIPGLEKAQFVKLCDKYNITLQDSEAFVEDRKVVINNPARLETAPTVGG